MTRTGVIREVCGDGYARVEIAMRTACGLSCEDCGGCAPGSRELVVRARNPLEAGPGDTVAVTAGTGKVLGAVALVYVLPLALMLAAALACGVCGGNQTHCALAALAALCLGAGLAVLLGKLRQKRSPVEYVITRRFSLPPAGNNTI